MKHGKIFVVSAPSGAGKTTLCGVMLKKNPELSYSVSHTTRAPRANEKESIDYFFITKDDFQQGIEKKIWAEWAMVHDNYYGTSLEFIKEKIASGSSLLLDIDVQGAEQIRKSFPRAVTIFIMAPSFEILEQRLFSRGTDSEDVIKKRLKNAETEIAGRDSYDYVVINDDLDKAAREMDIIINGE